MKFHFLIVFYALTVAVYGQSKTLIADPTNSKSTELHSGEVVNPKIIKARSLILTGKTEKAIALLNKTYSKSKDPAFAKELAAIYNQKNQSNKAMEWANKAALKESLIKDDVQLYAKLLMQQGDYQTALDHCLHYALLKNDSKGIAEIAYACENLIVVEKQSVLFKLNTVPFNTSADEVSITNYRNGFVMATNGLSENARFDFYKLQQDYNKWRYPEVLLRTPDAKINRTSLSYTIDGNYVYYTTYDFLTEKEMKKLNGASPKFSIYSGISLGNEWVEVQAFPFQIEGFSYKDPAIHPNGKMLVFSSDQNQKDNFDLYISILEQNEWSYPQSLGSNVNTDKDEVKPYFAEDGTLYFSSNNPLGFGGFDLYKTKRTTENIWIKPDILPSPLNSTYDDMSIIFHYGRPGGYLVSNRNGNYDIYQFEDFNLKMSVSVMSKENGTLLPYAVVKLWKENVLIEEKLTGKNGDVSFQVANGNSYTIEVIKEGFQDFSKKVSAADEQNGGEFFVNAQLLNNTDYAKANADKEVKFNDQNFVDVTIEIVSTDQLPVARKSVKMINVNSGRMKVIETDDNGKFEQSLYIGNDYKLIIDYNNQTFEKLYSTKDMNVGKQDVLFILEH